MQASPHNALQSFVSDQMYTITHNRSHCHGNVRVNHDSKSHSIPIAWRMILHPVDLLLCAECM